MKYNGIYNPIHIHMYIYIYIHARDIFQPTASHHGFQEEHDLPNHSFCWSFLYIQQIPFRSSKLAVSKEGSLSLSELRCKHLLKPLEAIDGEREGRDRGAFRLLKAVSILLRSRYGEPVAAGGSRCASKRCMGLPWISIYKGISHWHV